MWLKCVTGYCVDGSGYCKLCQTCLFRKLPVSVTTCSASTRHLYVEVYIAIRNEKSEYLAGMNRRNSIPCRVP